MSQSDSGRAVVIEMSGSEWKATDGEDSIVLAARPNGGISVTVHNDEMSEYSAIDLPGPAIASLLKWAER